MGIGRSIDCSMRSKKTNKHDIYNLNLLQARYWRGIIHMTTSVGYLSFTYSKSCVGLPTLKRDVRARSYSLRPALEL